MKINTLEELSALVKIYFSDKTKEIKVEEEEILKKQIKEAIERIDGSIGKLKDIALSQLRNYGYLNDYFRGEIKLVKFVCECLSNEDRVQLVKSYLRSIKTIEGHTLIISREHLLIMLDYLPDDLKVKSLTNAQPADLIRIMGEINKMAINRKLKKASRKYYQGYYNIFKEVMVNN